MGKQAAVKTAKVYFTDFRTEYGGRSLPEKLKKLARTAGLDQIDMEGKFVAIKMHFGELGKIQLPASQLRQGGRRPGERARRQTVSHRL